MGRRAGRTSDRRAYRPRSNKPEEDVGAGAAQRRGVRIIRAEHLKAVTLAQVAIHTGRTHQIRVHLSAIGHPIVGDPLYGGLHRRVPGDLRAVTHLDRPFLHAARLAFKHPADGRRMEFTSELPDDLQRVLDELREKQKIAD
jgi:23S rRNA pseudouridine1911/1915/1917 synthase